MYCALALCTVAGADDATYYWREPKSGKSRLELLSSASLCPLDGPDEKQLHKMLSLDVRSREPMTSHGCVITAGVCPLNDDRDSSK